jgi:hypothetical protein
MPPRVIGQRRTALQQQPQRRSVTIGSKRRVGVTVQSPRVSVSLASKQVDLSILGTGPAGPAGPPGPSPIVQTSNTYAIGGLITAGMSIPMFYVAAGSGEVVTLVKLRWSTGTGAATFDLLHGAYGGELEDIITGLEATSEDATQTLETPLAIADGDKLSINVTDADDGTDLLTVSFIFEHQVNNA